MSNFYIPMAKTAQEAAFHARIAERAEVLFSEGYTYEYVTALASGGYYRVTSPQGESYIVDPLIGKCGCRCFEKNAICKHVLAIDRMEKECEALEIYEESKYF